MPIFIWQLLPTGELKERFQMRSRAMQQGYILCMFKQGKSVKITLKHFRNDENRAPHIGAFHPSHAEHTIRLSIATLLNRAGYSVEAHIILKVSSDPSKSIIYEILFQQLTSTNTVACYSGMMHAATGDASVLTGPESAIDYDTEQISIQLKLTNKERKSMFSNTFYNYAKAASDFKVSIFILIFVPEYILFSGCKKRTQSKGWRTFRSIF